MRKAWFRSLLFNLAFYGVTATLSILYIPALLLPRETFVALVRVWLRTVMVLEYAILGLKYKVTGQENLPRGSYIVAAKHQSAYETLKLHLIFHDPAIILKKELLWIPLFGAYLKKSGAIAIDRSTPEQALRSVQSGVRRVQDEGRPIVIFLQGTRVPVDVTTAEKPYKPGIVRIQDVTGLPIVPLALNSGLFWPRNSWFKTPGTVTFQLLKPIEAGKDRQTLMAELEDKIETATNTLVAQARPPRFATTRRLEILKKILLAFMIAAIFGFYVLWWNMVSQSVQNRYMALHNYSGAVPPAITGFPGVMKIRLPEELINTTDGSLDIRDIFIKGLPLPLAPITITTGPVTITSYKWSAPLTLEGIEARGTYWNYTVNIKDSLIKKDDFRAAVTGTVDLGKSPVPEASLVVAFMNHQGFLETLAQNGIMDPQVARFMIAGFTALQDEKGVVRVPVTQRGVTLYAGPFAFAELPITAPPSEATGTLQAPSP